MKFKVLLPVAGALLALAGPAAAVTLTFSPGIYGPPGSPLDGVDGWSVSDPGSDLNADTIPDGYLAFRTSLDGSSAGAIGGWYNEPQAGLPTDVLLSRSFGGILDTLTFSAKFAIAGSTEDVPGRDGFGFAFLGAGDSNLITISFEPVASVNSDAFRVSYTIGNTHFFAQDGNGDPMYIYHNGLYSISLAFAENGANPTFSATVTGSNAQTFTGTAAGLGSAQIQKFGAEWNVFEAGNNHFIIDDVTLEAVPEPGSIVLLGSAVGLLALRRRRRA